jgi:two-component system NtrC family sensor kinase
VILAWITRPGIRARFVAVMVLGTLAFGAIVLTFLRVLVVDALQKTTQDSYFHLLEAIASDIGDHVLTGRNFDLQILLFEATRRDPHLQYLIVIDSEGEVIASSYGSQVPAQLQLLLAEAEAGTNDPSGDSLLLRDRGHDLLHLRVGLLGGQLGSLHAGIEQESMQASAARITLNLLAIFVALTLAGVVAAFWLGRLLTEPLRRMAVLARRIGAGDLWGRIPVRSDDEVGELAAAFNDMSTQLAASRQALIRSEKLATAGELAAGVAHEINNPLASLQACLWALKKPDLPEDERIRHLDSLSKGLGRIARTVKQLLGFARPSRTSRARVRLDEVVARAVHLVRPSLPEDRIAIELDLESELPKISVDRDQIEQLLVNLLLNAGHAIQETSRDGTISIRLRGAEAGQLLEVIDDGPGIPQENLERVFAPFFTSRVDGQGSGLGLSVSEGIAEAHGGRLTLHPGPGGSGVRARLSLPKA